jgi:hypothetical protein
VQVLNRSVNELSPEDHPLIFAVNMSTGKRFHTQPTEVRGCARLAYFLLSHCGSRMSTSVQVAVHHMLNVVPTAGWHGWSVTCWIAGCCHPQVLAYQSAVVLPPYPPGKALGTFGGLQFGLGLKRTDTRCAFDATLGRTVTVAYAGQPLLQPNILYMP